MDQPIIPILALFTLVAVLVIAVVLYLRFMRKPQNRHPLDSPEGRQMDQARARQNAQGRTEVPPTRKGY